MALVARPQYEREVAEAPIKARQRFAEAMEHYRRECEDYRRDCEKVQLQNEDIVRRNRERADRHEQEQAAYREALAAHERRNSDDRLHKLTTKLRERLDRTLAGQESVFLSIHRQSIRSVRLQTIFSLRFLSAIIFLLGYGLISVKHPLLALQPVLLLRGDAKSLKRQALANIKRNVCELYSRAGLCDDDSFTASYHIASYRGRRTRPRIIRGFCKELLNFYDAPPIDLVSWYLRIARYLALLPFAGYALSALVYFVLSKFLPMLTVQDFPLPSAAILGCYFRYLTHGYVLFAVADLALPLFPSVTTQRIKQLADSRRETALRVYKTFFQNHPEEIAFLQRRHKRPTPPPPPTPDESLWPLPSPPTRPTMSVVLPPEPQPPAYDDGSEGNYEHTLRGSLVYQAKHAECLARRRIFSDNQVQPYFFLAGVPIPFYDNESPHITCMGESGSGKTTILRGLMSALLPLTQSQADRIVQRSPNIWERLPLPHEWSRSFTYQAVVYDSKRENIPFLEALGFNTDADLIILDPADERCFAWDVARDISDRDSINQFADLLVPVATKDENKKQGDVFWDALARRMIKAIIISLRNAALAKGKKPDWNLRDLARAVGTPETLSEVLGYHDVPAEVRAQLLDLDGPQKSSVYLTATNYIAQFEEVGERWAEAERRGRKISFKDWAKNGVRSVLVLPYTPSNPAVYEPLMRVFCKALTNIVLQHEYSRVTDEFGDHHIKQRYFFLDELGSAGEISDMQRLMSEGRSFGVHVVLGVHQLSQMRQTYGNNGADTILGLCSYAVLLKTGDPPTAKWMSERIGDALVKYETKALATGTVDGTSHVDTDGRTLTHTDGTSDANSKGKAWGTVEGTNSGESKSVAGRNGVTKNEGTSHSRNKNFNEQETKTITASDADAKNNSTARGSNHADSKTNTTSEQLRQEGAIFAGEFLSLLAPAATGKIAAYVVAPSLPRWRADIPFEQFAPRLEFPDAKDDVTRCYVPWKDQEQVSKSKPWTLEDYNRLSMDMPPPKRDQKRLPPSDRGDNNGDLDANFDF